MTRLFNWLDSRRAGILLHPTCLPGDQGIGTFDGAADRFLAFLAEAGMGAWQICPLGPTSYGDSPYQCFSAFAGNPYLIDLRALVKAGLLAEADLAGLAELPRERVDFGGIYRLKVPLLRKAAKRFAKSKVALGEEDFGEFKEAQAGWLDDYAHFRALKDHFGGKPWTQWPAGARGNAAAKGSALRAKLAPEAEAHKFGQYVFFMQWRRVRKAAADLGISIIGDIPIFVAADSADVWSHPELFELDPKTGAPVAVAGVPPDYFSADGQLWGNPLYVWERHAETAYAWWHARLKASFELYDVVRIDHFRGFDAYWRVPLPAANAKVGEWTPGPGLGFFQSIRDAFPKAKIIAEDLGVLTDSVVKLREDTGLPGMAVLQFAFGGDAGNLYLPHHLAANEVVYPGTHDNDTSLGWYASADGGTKDHARRYLRVDGREIGWDLIRAAYEAPCRLAVTTLQDILSLGSEGRLNSPGKAEGNWQWRMSEGQLAGLSGGKAGYLRELGGLYGRTP